MPIFQYCIVLYCRFPLFCSFICVLEAVDYFISAPSFQSTLCIFRFTTKPHHLFLFLFTSTACRTFDCLTLVLPGILRHADRCIPDLPYSLRLALNLSCLRIDYSDFIFQSSDQFWASITHRHNPHSFKNLTAFVFYRLLRIPTPIYLARAALKQVFSFIIRTL